MIGNSLLFFLVSIMSFYGFFVVSSASSALAEGHKTGRALAVQLAECLMDEGRAILHSCIKDLPPTELSVFEEEVFSKLKKLDLSGMELIDISPLAKLSELVFLDLSNTKVSDVSPLYPLSSLRILSLRGTAVSREQIDALKERNPDLTLGEDLFKSFSQD